MNEPVGYVKARHTVVRAFHAIVYKQGGMTGDEHMEC